jgi:hypothetical protein
VLFAILLLFMFPVLDNAIETLKLYLTILLHKQIFCKRNINLVNYLYQCHVRSESQSHLKSSFKLKIENAFAEKLYAIVEII